MGLSSRITLTPFLSAGQWRTSPVLAPSSVLASRSPWAHLDMPLDWRHMMLCMHCRYGEPEFQGEAALGLDSSFDSSYSSGGAGGSPEEASWNAVSGR